LTKRTVLDNIDVLVKLRSQFATPEGRWIEDLPAFALSTSHENVLRCGFRRRAARSSQKCPAFLYPTRAGHPMRSQNPSPPTSYRARQTPGHRAAGNGRRPRVHDVTALPEAFAIPEEHAAHSRPGVASFESGRVGRRETSCWDATFAYIAFRVDL
jgi:hypothetical protein